MTPDLAQGSVLDCEVTWAETSHPVSWLSEMKRKESAGSLMSPPPPCTVQLPLLSDWSPEGVGKPMSLQAQPEGHRSGGAGALVAR